MDQFVAKAKKMLESSQITQPVSRFIQQTATNVLEQRIFLALQSLKTQLDSFITLLNTAKNYLDSDLKEIQMADNIMEQIQTTLANFQQQSKDLKVKAIEKLQHKMKVRFGLIGFAD